jgi:hypothetical protein
VTFPHSSLTIFSFFISNLLDLTSSSNSLFLTYYPLLCLTLCFSYDFMLQCKLASFEQITRDVKGLLKVWKWNWLCAKGYGIQVWCYWEHLREHLENLMKKLKMHWEHMGTPICIGTWYWNGGTHICILLQKLKQSYIHTLHQSPKLKTIVGQVSLFEEKCEFLFLTKFRRIDPILEKIYIFSNFHTHSDFSKYLSKWNKPLAFKKTHFPIAWSISTKERGDQPNKTPSLDKPSPALTTCLEMDGGGLYFL